MVYIFAKCTVYFHQSIISDFISDNIFMQKKEDNTCKNIICCCHSKPKTQKPSQHNFANGVRYQFCLLFRFGDNFFKCPVEFLIYISIMKLCFFLRGSLFHLSCAHT